MDGRLRPRRRLLLEDKYLDWSVFRDSEAHISEVVNEFISNMPQEDAWRGGQDRGYPWGAVRTLDDIIEDPHLQDRDFFTRVEHPELGKAFTYPGRRRYTTRRRGASTGGLR